MNQSLFGRVDSDVTVKIQDSNCRNHRNKHKTIANKVVKIRTLSRGIRAITN